jgi:hypothetical protein
MWQKKNYVLKARIDKDRQKQIQDLVDKKNKKGASKTTRSSLTIEMIDDYFNNDRFFHTEYMDKLWRTLMETGLDLSRVTGNLNQIAHHMNRGDTVAQEDIVKTINELITLNKTTYHTINNFAKEIENKKMISK